MNTFLKKKLALVLILCCLLGLIPYSVSAEEYENTHVNTGNHRIDIVEVAKTQIGFREGKNNDTKYGSWYGLPNQPWCAMFVSWCARQAGIPTSILRNCAIADPCEGYFDIPYYDGEDYTPQTGDLFFTKNFSHVGIVYYTDGDVFYSIEGNTNTDGSNEGIGVFLRSHKISGYYFGVPDYNSGSEQEHKCDKAACIHYETAHPHYSCFLCSVCKAINPDYSTFNFMDGCVICEENHVKGYVGDADGDRIITIKDATTMQKHIAGLISVLGDSLLFADVDADLSLTIKDATAVQKYIANIVIEYPVGEVVNTN